MNSWGADVRAALVGGWPAPRAAVAPSHWRHALLTSTALAVASPVAVGLPLAALFTALSATATMADGGAGGYDWGGVGGIDSPTSQGGTSAGSSYGIGGSGGGAGATGGAGARGGSGFGGAGGVGGGAAGHSGGNGSNSPFHSGDGAGGGGGGAHGFVGAALPGAAVGGGAGGNGGSDESAGDGGGGGGGGGGAGGYGAVVTGTGSLGTLGSAVTGGRGGDGGEQPDGAGGAGGTGGFGLLFTNAAGATFTVSAAVQGGAGGVGAWDGTPAGSTNGASGAGIVGQNLSIIMGAAGSVAGGSGANAIVFTGGTNRLELQAGTTITGNVVAFSAADTLALGGAGNASFDMSKIGLAAQYQGFGAYEKTGASTWTLTGTTAAATPWAINGGTLGVSADGNLGAASGGLTFNGGTLRFGAGFNLASSRAIALNAGGGTFDTNGFNTTVSQAISGSGGLTKAGAGTLILSGASAYTGGTAIDGGTLLVNGDLTSSSGITVNAGARLAGIGTVGATTIKSGGLFAPGAGTPGSSMNVAGNLAFQSGALYLVQVDPSNASRANVTAGGTATLAGTATATFAPGNYLTRSYTILSAAGGLGGTTFNALATNNLPVGFTARLDYTNSDVLLNLTATLATTGLPGNQGTIAVTLNNFFNGGGALPPAFLPVFGLTGGNFSDALSRLSGESATGAQQSAFQLGGQFLNLMLDPSVGGRGRASGSALGYAASRAPLPEEIARAYAKAMKATDTDATLPGFAPRWSAWGGGFGGASRSGGDAMSGNHDLSARAAGFAAGIDYRLTPDMTAGFALAGGGTNWSLAQGLGGGKSDAFQAGVYGTMRAGPAYLATAFAYAQHWMSTDRIAFAGDHLTAAFNAPSFGGRIEGGYRTATLLGGITPYAALQAQNFRTPSYRETDLTGSGFALAYDARSATAARSELGTRFDHAVALDSAALLTLRARLAWAHDWVSDPTLVAGFQTLPGASFIISGAAPAKDFALASVGAEMRLANGVTLLGKLDGEFAARATTYSGTATVRYAW